MKQLTIKECMVMFTVTIILASYLMYMVTYLGAFVSSDKTIIVGIDWFGEAKFESIINLISIIASFWVVPYIIKKSKWWENYENNIKKHKNQTP